VRGLVERAGWALAGALALALLATLAGIVDAGPLDPPGPPGPTDSVKLPGTPISSLPFTIDSPGYYYLTRNLASFSGQHISIDADNVTLDLNGFTLFNVQASSDGIASVNVNVTYESLTVRNGVISNWANGISLPNFVSSVFEDLRVTHNSNTGIYIGSGNVVRRTVVTYNQTGLEIKQRGEAWGGWVTDSDIRKNTTGLVLRANNQHVVGNVVGVNTEGLAVQSRFNEVIDNDIIGNTMGLRMYNMADVGDTTVARNRFIRNDTAVQDNGSNNKIGTFVGGDASITATNPWSNVVY
jgi:hypothetical protein